MGKPFPWGVILLDKLYKFFVDTHQTLFFVNFVTTLKSISSRELFTGFRVVLLMEQSAFLSLVVLALLMLFVAGVILMALSLKSLRGGGLRVWDFSQTLPCSCCAAQSAIAPNFLLMSILAQHPAALWLGMD
jgi:hypothetical protein